MSTHETWLLNESGLDWQNFQNIHISNQQDIIHYNRISLEPLQLGFLLLKVLKLFNSLINYYGYHSTKLLLILLARFYKFNNHLSLCDVKVENISWVLVFRSNFLFSFSGNTKVVSKSCLHLVSKSVKQLFSVFYFLTFVFENLSSTIFQMIKKKKKPEKENSKEK